MQDSANKKNQTIWHKKIIRTPTFALNGRAIQGALPYDSFREVIEEELTKASTE